MRHLEWKAKCRVLHTRSTTYALSPDPKTTTSYTISGSKVGAFPTSKAISIGILEKTVVPYLWENRRHTPRI